MPANLSPQKTISKAHMQKHATSLLSFIQKKKKKRNPCSKITVIWKTEQQYLILDQQQVLRVKYPIKRAIYAYLFDPVTAHVKNSSSAAIF